MTLKSYHANDIAAAMSGILEDESFAGLYRTASLEQKAEDKGEKKPCGCYVADGPCVHDGLVADDAVSETPAEKPGEEAPACDAGDIQLAIAIDFAVERLSKVAGALDKSGFAGVADKIDAVISNLSDSRPKVAIAAAKKGKKNGKGGDGKPGRSYKEWLKALPDGKDKEAFRKRYEGAMETAKKKGMKKKDAEEYAARTAIDKLPKKYLKEPTGVHGPGKSGPKVKKGKK